MPKPFISIVVPTYKEEATIGPLIAQLATAMRGQSWELVVVDDSPTPYTAENAVRNAERHRVKLTLINRYPARGLATAIIRGIQDAQGDIIVFMDADGSHRPDDVPPLISALQQGQCAVALGCRWVRGGSAQGWDWKRRVLSRGFSVLGHYVTGLSDPSTGFCAFYRDRVHIWNLRPLSWKVALEVVYWRKDTSYPLGPVVEVPIEFVDRTAGQSKNGLREVWPLLCHLWILWRGRYYSPAGLRPKERTA